MSRPIPLLDDVPLDATLWIRQTTRPRVASIPVAGLEGDVQQALGRGSHEVELRGVLVGEGAVESLHKLQKKAASKEEVVFTADITTALDIQKAVILEATFSEEAGRPGRYDYHLIIQESPPLPEPASLGGLGGLGLGDLGGLEGFDLGFDTDILGDIADMAGELQNAIEAAASALDKLQALASLGSLAAGNPLGPLQQESSRATQSVSKAGELSTSLGSLLGGG